MSVIDNPAIWPVWAKDKLLELRRQGEGKRLNRKRFEYALSFALHLDKQHREPKPPDGVSGLGKLEQELRALHPSGQKAAGRKMDGPIVDKAQPPSVDPDFLTEAAKFEVRVERVLRQELGLWPIPADDPMRILVRNTLREVESQLICTCGHVAAEHAFTLGACVRKCSCKQFENDVSLTQRDPTVAARVAIQQAQHRAMADATQAYRAEQAALVASAGPIPGPVLSELAGMRTRLLELAHLARFRSSQPRRKFAIHLELAADYVRRAMENKE